MRLINSKFLESNWNANFSIPQKYQWFCNTYTVREDVPEISLDQKYLCIYSLFMTFVDVYDKGINLELK